MSRANRKRKNTGRPLKYKSKNINWSAVDYAIEVDKKLYTFDGIANKLSVSKFRGAFQDYIKDRAEIKRKESFTHTEAVFHCLALVS